MLVILGISGSYSAIGLTSELILLVFLPPLLFEGAMNMDLGDLELRWRQVAVLAFAGTAISASVIALFLTTIPKMTVEHAVISPSCWLRPIRSACWPYSKKTGWCPKNAERGEVYRFDWGFRATHLR